MTSNNLCMNKKFTHGHKHGKCLIQLHLKPTESSLINGNNIAVKLKPQIKTRPSLNIVHPNTKKNAPPVTSLQTQLNTQNQANSSSSNASNNQRVFSNLGILSQGGNLNVMGTMAGPSVRRGGGCGCGR